APAIEQLSIAVGETSRSASSPQHLGAPNLPEPQDSSEASIGSTLDVAPVVDLSTTAGETTKAASSPQFFEVPNSSEPQESSEATASAMDVTPAIEPFTAVGERGPATVPPGMDTNNIENNNVAIDPSLAASPAASSPGTSVTSTAVTASVGS